jgi:hypothetical protein
MSGLALCRFLSSDRHQTMAARNAIRRPMAGKIPERGVQVIAYRLQIAA